MTKTRPRFSHRLAPAETARESTTADSTKRKRPLHTRRRGLRPHRQRLEDLLVITTAAKHRPCPQDPPCKPDRPRFAALRP